MDLHFEAYEFYQQITAKITRLKKAKNFEEASYVAYTASKRLLRQKAFNSGIEMLATFMEICTEEEIVFNGLVKSLLELVDGLENFDALDKLAKKNLNSELELAIGECYLKNGNTDKALLHLKKSAHPRARSLY